MKIHIFKGENTKNHIDKIVQNVYLELSDKVDDPDLKDFDLTNTFPVCKLQPDFYNTRIF